MSETISHSPQCVAASERGTALILALVFTIVASGIVFTGAMIEKSTRERTSTAWRVQAQTTQYARAGLTEATSWFRRQVTQPVTAFEPIIDLEANPPILDTLDPEVGIVREFRIRGRLWGRYEVWKQWDNDPDRERLAWRNLMRVNDVSAERGVGNEGTSWRLRSLGYVFEREDPSVAFNEAPNRVLAMEGVEAEILRRKLAPPGEAAIAINRADWLTINSNARVEGLQRTGAYYPRRTGRVAINRGSLTGSPAKATSRSALDLSSENVFGVSYYDLRSSADLVVADLGNFPTNLTENATLVVDTGGAVVFDRHTPLRGRGLVYVNGNCTIEAGSNSVFVGMLYVDGDLVVNAPSEIEGAVVCTGRITLNGSGDRTTIRYGDAVLNALRQDIGQYKYLGAMRRMNRPQ